jgi:hypothetical protein
MPMRISQAPAFAVQITGTREAIDWALQQGLLPDAHFHALHGMTWIEVPAISQEVELEMTAGGCRVHHKA